MKHPILVIENYPGRADCIVRLLKQFGVPFILVASNGASLSIPNGVSGMILSGGPQSVTDIELKPGLNLRPVMELLNLAEKRRVPVLGICLGHQLLGAWAGGEVAKLPVKVAGFEEISLLKESLLFEKFPDRTLQAFQFHEDHLRNLPMSCDVLATSKSCEVEAFAVRGRRMWGVQFHPEITFADGKAILGGDLPLVRPWVSESDVNAPYLIKSFTALCCDFD